MKNYKEFTKDYKWSLKKYNALYGVFDILDTKSILEEVKRFELIGTKWEEVESKTNRINGEFYLNVVESVPFFRNLGGVETIQKSWTKFGNIPTKIISTNPTRTQKTTRIYKFD